jgi:hypothetical protein
MISFSIFSNVYRPGRESYSFERSNLISNSSKETMDIHDDLKDDSDLIILNTVPLKGKNSINPQTYPLESSSSNVISDQIAESSDNNIYENQLLFKLEMDRFITPDEKVQELMKELTKTKNLYTLKLLFENLQNEFSSQTLINSLKALANPTLFNYYSKENIIRLELHLRTWVAVLEQIHFSPSSIVLSKDLQDKIYNSLAKFAEIHHKTTQVINKSQDDDKILVKKCNYNIDFLLIHLRDTLQSLHGNKTVFRELVRKIRDFLKSILNIAPSTNNYSTFQMITQLRQDFNPSFKNPVPSYYIDWRIILIIQQNIYSWSEDGEQTISKKFGEMILMEYCHVID